MKNDMEAEKALSLFFEEVRAEEESRRIKKGEFTRQEFASKANISLPMAQKRLTFLVKIGKATVRKGIDEEGHPCCLYQLKKIEKETVE